MTQGTRFNVRYGMKVRLADDHPNSPGKEATIVYVGAYQIQVRVLDDNRETWAFSDQVEILEP
jgi:hypothetical protein